MGNIGIFGIGRTAINTVEALSAKGIENIIAFPDQIDGKHTWRPSFRTYCREKSVEFISLPDISSPRVLEILKSKKITTIFSAHSEVIITNKVIEMVGGEVFNLHFSLLPKCRGLFPTFWHIINGDEFAGVTLHKITETIDTGEIVDQIKIPITRETTNWNLFLECTKKSGELIRRNVDQILAKRYQAREQNVAESSYYSKKSVNFSENFVNWNDPIEKVARFIQAFIFPPLQYPRTRYKKHIIEILKLIDYKKASRTSTPGTVISKKNGLCEIQAGDGTCVLRVSPYTMMKEGERVYY